MGFPSLLSHPFWISSFFLLHKPKNTHKRWIKLFSNRNTHLLKKRSEKNAWWRFFFRLLLPSFRFFFPPFIIWEKSEDIEKKTLMVSCVLEKKNNCEKRRKINGVEVVCIITRCWSCGLVKTLMLSRSPVLIWAWRVSGWVRVFVWGGTCILATLASYLGRIFPTLWHCSHHFEPKDFLFSLPNFFPPINVWKDFISSWISQCKFYSN